MIQQERQNIDRVVLECWCDHPETNRPALEWLHAPRTGRLWLGDLVEHFLRGNRFVSSLAVGAMVFDGGGNSGAASPNGTVRMSLKLESKMLASLVRSNSNWARSSWVQVRFR